MIRDNVLEVRRGIESACFKAKRDPDTVKLVAVSKNRSIEEIKEASLAGITAFGENRVQEALSKYEAKLPIQWHMVGHLQTNKVKEAVKIFDLIQSVDSLRLAQEIDKQAAGINKIQEILLEVKTSAEKTKFGLPPDELPGFLKAARELKNISVQGLMTIAPLVDDPQEARPYFRILKELKNRVDPEFILSMGMTGDFQVAIEEGADIVRVGRAIFEGKI
ncbi:MAG: YggS family pyridoxal phosphate-dependent enzyme [Candidatus Omnitrophica bacterium]|nr:YggS family pyridoxal phosphate-dependent enzyme [Candidatus Omnitrophota bacterium]